MVEKLPIRYAILASGSGTTAEAIVRACKSGGLLHGLIEPVCFIASKPDIKAIDKVRVASRGTSHIHIVNPKSYDDSEQFGQALIEVFQQEQIDLFGQHGWLPLTPTCVLEQYRGINQHPGPLPYFGGKGMYGRRVHAAVLHFRRLVNHRIWTEATAQFVHPEFDKGQVLIRQPVPVFDDDTVASLQERVLPVEHLVQIFALMKYVVCSGYTEELPSLDIPLVLHSELDTLEKAKALAIADYPTG